MTSPDAPTQALLRRAADGESEAVNELLDRYRDRLSQMIRMRMDARLKGRFDPSDVVQEALVTAATKLTEYLQDQPLPFYPWLRQIAWNRLVDLHRHNVQMAKRSVAREEQPRIGLSDESLAALVSRFAGGSKSPSSRLIRRELQDRLRQVLDQLDAHDREVLILRHLEELSIEDIAAILGISRDATKQRHIRALRRLQNFLEQDPEWKATLGQ